MTPAVTAADAGAPVLAGHRTMGGLVRYVLRLGCTGFGGPIALGYMQRDLVEQRRWFTEQEYRQGVARAQTMPGPLAAQLAMWFGFLQAGGAALAVPFVLPPCLLVTAVAVLYTQYQGLAVIAVGVCAMAAIARTEIVWLFLAAGAFGVVYYGGGLPRGPTSSAASVSPIGLVAAVKGFAWTGSGSVAVAMGLISPGPVVIMATFAGYLVSGLSGALIATAAVFLPVYLFVIVPGRALRRHGDHTRLQGFIKGATAAAAGAIAGAAIVIGEQVISTWAPVAIAIAGAQGAVAATDQGSRARDRRGCSGDRDRNPPLA